MQNPFRRNGGQDTPHDRPSTSDQDQPNGGRTLEPSPETLAELDALNAASRAAPDEIDPQIRLWAAVSRLDRWIFINRGTDDAPRPYTLAAQPGQMISVYSSGARAQEAAYTNGLVPADTTVPLLAVPMPAAIDWVLSFGQSGVTGVAIDYPRLSAWCPLPNLARFRPAPPQA